MPVVTDEVECLRKDVDRLRAIISTCDKELDGCKVLVRKVLAMLRRRGHPAKGPDLELLLRLADAVGYPWRELDQEHRPAEIMQRQLVRPDINKLRQVLSNEALTESDLEELGLWVES